MDRACPESGVRIYLDRHGKVTVNGKAVSLESLGGTLGWDPCCNSAATYRDLLFTRRPATQTSGSGKRCDGRHDCTTPTDWDLHGQHIQDAGTVKMKCCPLTEAWSGP